MKQFFLISLLIFVFAFSVKAQYPTIVCGSVCGNCNVPHLNNPPDDDALPGEFYSQVWKLYNASDVFADNVELRAERAYFNNDETNNILEDITYLEEDHVYFSINTWTCKSVQLNFSISPSQSGHYKIYYGMYVEEQRLTTLEGGDLWIDINIAVPTCPPPGNLTPGNISNTTATITFNANGDFTRVSWKPTGPANWESTITYGSSVVLTGLSPNTEYVVNAQSGCGNITSDFAVTYFTTTSSGSGTCDIPAGLYTNSVGINYARANWIAVSGASVYHIRYRKSGDSWTSELTNTTTYFMQNLISSTQYEWQVATQCSGGIISDWSQSEYFTTACEVPDAIFSISQSEVLMNEEFHLTDLSTKTPTSWNWQIEDGATSQYTIQNPSNVSITSPGMKNIILTVQNNCGSDVASATIKVLPNQGDPPYDISHTREDEHHHIDVGDPVNPYTGEYSLPFTVITILGIGNEYDFILTYNSLNSVLSDVGWNWNHNYYYELEDSGDLWTVTDGQGKKQYFVPYDDGVIPLYGSEQSIMYQDAGSNYILEQINGTKIVFTAGTNFQKIIDRNSNEIVPTYNSLNQIITLTFPGKRYLSFSYTSSGLLNKIQDKAGRFVQLIYNNNNELEQLTNIDGDVFTFEYNSLHQITSIQDPKGNYPITHTFDGNNKVATQTDAEGNTIEFTYNTPVTGATRVKNTSGDYSYYYHDNLGQLTKYIDEEGNTTVFTMNDVGRPSQIINALGHTTSLSYDSQKNITHIEVPTGAEMSFEYGDYGLPTRITDPLGNITTLIYDANGNRQQVNLPNGSTITESTDEYGRPEWVEQEGQRTSFSYNPINWGGDLVSIADDDNYNYDLGRIIKTGFIEDIWDRKGNNIEYTYSNSGMLLKTEFDDYSTEQSVYDANYNLTQFTNRNGDAAQYTYYKNDWLKSITNALGQTVSIEYSPTGYPTKYTYPDGRTDVLTYYKNGWLKSITDDMGTILYTYNAAGRVVSVTDKMNRVSTFAYNDDGHLISFTNPLGQTQSWEYDQRDMTSWTNALGDITQYEYGSMGELLKVTDPLQHSNILQYDDLLHLTNVTDANSHITTLQYDNRSLLTSTTLPTNDSYTNTYDNEALVKTFADANGVSASIYRESNNRITDIYYSNGEWTGFHYYCTGELKDATNGLGTVSFQYDKLRQLTQETGVFGEVVQYVYNSTTNYLTEVIYPGNHSITYSYTKGLISRVEDWNGNWAEYVYFNSETLQKVTCSNGVTTSYTRDDADQIQTVLTSKGTDTICFYDLTRDAQNFIISIDQKQPIMPDFAYTSTTTSYDAADRPQSGGGSTYSNDANGNLTSYSDGTDTYDYGYAENNRITSSSFNGETTTRSYNALRKPVKLVKNGVETRYTFSNGLGLSKPIQQRNGSNTVTQHYIYGADGLAWMVDGSGDAHFYHVDYIGNIIALTNASGNITDSLACDPWGASVVHAGDTEQPFGYMGSYGVIDLGNTQYIVGARDYLGVLGRFVSADEYPANLFNTQSNQRYSMAYNSPYNFVDPSGYLPGWADGGNYSPSTYEEFLLQSSPQHEITAVPEYSGFDKLKVSFYNFWRAFNDGRDIGTSWNLRKSTLDYAENESISYANQDAFMAGYYFGFTEKLALIFSERGAGNALKGETYTESSLQVGQQMHKAYKAGLHNPAKGLHKEFTGVQGIRPDFVDMNKRIIYELKPNNPRQISAGRKQLNNYKLLFEQQYGGTWKTVLDLY